jgi:hypothetical protein
MDARETVIGIQHTSLYGRCLKGLRKRGGAAETAAKKAEAFMRAVSGHNEQGFREKFSLTRRGDARIRNCRKIDLGGGYRAVCLFRDGQLILLYAGSHDECARWLMRNRRMNCDFEAAEVNPAARERTTIEEAELTMSDNETECSDAYETALMNKIDDAVLRRVFSGLVKGRY